MHFKFNFSVENKRIPNVLQLETARKTSGIISPLELALLTQHLKTGRLPFCTFMITVITIIIISGTTVPVLFSSESSRLLYVN